MLVAGGLAKQKTQARQTFQKPPFSHRRQQLNKWPPDEVLLDLMANNILIFRGTIFLESIIQREKLQ